MLQSTTLTFSSTPAWRMAACASVSILTETSGSAVSTVKRRATPPLSTTPSPSLSLQPAAFSSRIACGIEKPRGFTRGEVYREPTSKGPTALTCAP